MLQQEQIHKSKKALQIETLRYVLSMTEVEESPCHWFSEEFIPSDPFLSSLFPNERYICSLVIGFTYTLLHRTTCPDSSSLISLFVSVSASESEE